VPFLRFYDRRCGEIRLSGGNQAYADRDDDDNPDKSEDNDDVNEQRRKMEDNACYRGLRVDESQLTNDNLQLTADCIRC
jgi:hypothetical protein